MIPVTIITGFLESGKTTTIMNILESQVQELKGTTLIIDLNP